MRFILFLLTIILYGMSKVVIKMVYLKNNSERVEKAKNNCSKISFAMYFPQIVMLTLAFILGLYMPDFLEPIIEIATAG